MSRKLVKTWIKAAGIVYPYVVKFVQANGRPPTMREIQHGCGISSTSVVLWYINELVTQGWLEKDDLGRLTVPGMEMVAGREVDERLAEVASECCPHCGEPLRLWLPGEGDEVELDGHVCAAVPA